MPLRKGHELVMIDISMPRNIDPRVGEVDNVKLFELDDLKEVVDANMKRREDSAVKVKAIIADKFNEYCVKINNPRLDLSSPIPIT